MHLTTAQRVTLKAAILADPAIAQTFIDGNLQGTADYYNALASPAFTVWRTSVTQSDITRSDGFDWTRVDNLSAGKARIWEWMFGLLDLINASKANVRTGIDTVWVGTQADLNVRAVVYIACKRLATRAEKLFATGTGSDVAPAMMVIEGAFDYTEFQGL